MIDRVLGIDPSWDCSGIGNIGPNILSCDRVPAGVAPKKGAVADDLRHMAVMVTKVLDRIDAMIYPGERVLAVFEGPSMGSRFGRPDERAGIRWMLVNQCVARGILVAYMPPSSLKKYWTDDGSASKEKMVGYTQHRYPDLDIPDHNANDGFALAHAGALHLGIVPMPGPPMVNRGSLLRVRWPSDM